MRLRAGLGVLLLWVGGCSHLPEGVQVDLGNDVIEVGPCRCELLPSQAPEEDGQPR